MAERRMFAKTIIDSDSFLDMPPSTQCLYFHLSMRADDEGFLNNPKRIQRMIGASDDDLKLLIAKNFLITFETGVVVIKHWRIHNYIQKDRFKKTVYQEEREFLSVKDNGAYTVDTECIQNGYNMDTECIQNGYNMDTQVRIGKDSIGKYRIVEDSLVKESIGECTPDKPVVAPKDPKHKYGEYNHVLLKDTERDKLFEDYGESDTLEAIQYLDEYIEMKGAKYKSHYLALRKWVFDALKEKRQKAPKQESNIVDKWLKAAGECDG